MKNRSKNVKLVACIISLISIVSLTGISAYLTDMEVSYNTFTVGEVNIQVEEPAWSSAIDSNEDGTPDYADNITPNSVIEKDPLIENIGENSAYVYFKVKVPVANVVVAEDNGTIKKSDAQYTQLFTYDVSNKWNEIYSERDTIKNDEGNPEYYTYVYSYESPLINKYDKTESLFKSIKFANITEKPKELDNDKCQIILEAYAIQSENLPKDITTSQEAYAIYLNQSNSEINN